MLPDSKTGAKIVYLNRQAVDVIAGIPGRKATGLLFPSFRNPDKPITLGIHWSKIRNRAALPDVRLHDLRHSFASVAIRDNISLMVIGKLLGHALAETTTRYAHLPMFGPRPVMPILMMATSSRQRSGSAIG